LEKDDHASNKLSAQLSALIRNKPALINHIEGQFPVTVRMDGRPRTSHRPMGV
jgi:hypothetical protein